MNQNEALTVCMNQQRMLMEILTEHWDKTRVTAKLHRGMVRVMIDFDIDVWADAVLGIGGDND